jgi:hypothetical protein
MTVAIRQEEEEEAELQQQQEELRLKKLSKMKQSVTFSSMLTKSELEIHQTTTSDSRASTPAADSSLLFPQLNSNGKGSKGKGKGEDNQQMSSRKLKKIIKVCLLSLFSHLPCLCSPSVAAPPPPPSAAGVGLVEK